MADPDLLVVYEHPEWQKPLFAALERRGVSFAALDIKAACFSDVDPPRAKLAFNQASPSAYVRGNERAVPFALAYLRALETMGAPVLNGADVFALELSKSAQAALMRRVGVDGPRSLVFNDLDAMAARAHEIGFPALLKPEQGGSGARIHKVDSVDEVRRLFDQQPNLWAPDNLFLLQEFLPHDPDRGIVRLEFLGGELLYSMRVVTHGRYNLCPAPVCNPEDGEAGICEVPQVDAKPVEFYPFKELPAEALRDAKKLVDAARLDVGGIEYLETPDGRRVFYDVNANSNLRPSVAAAFGFDPFERVVDYLQRRLAAL